MAFHILDIGWTTNDTEVGDSGGGVAIMLRWAKSELWTDL
jgi:hypothetical protein